MGNGMGRGNVGRTRYGKGDRREAQMARRMNGNTQLQRVEGTELGESLESSKDLVCERCLGFNGNDPSQNAQQWGEGNRGDQLQ